MDLRMMAPWKIFLLIMGFNAFWIILAIIYGKGGGGSGEFRHPDV